MTRIGNLLGEKNARRAGVASKMSIMMAFMIGCIWRYARSLLNLGCSVQNGDDRSKYADDDCFFFFVLHKQCDVHWVS